MAGSKDCSSDDESSSAHEQPHQPFRLLDLPPELWSRIVRLAATPPKPIKLSGVLTKQRFASSVAQPAITRTCKAIRAEYLHAFYAASSFVFVDDIDAASEYALEAWLMKLPLAYKLMLDLKIMSQCNIDDVLAFFNEFLEASMGTKCVEKVAGDDSWSMDIAVRHEVAYELYQMVYTAEKPH